MLHAVWYHESDTPTRLGSGLAETPTRTLDEGPVEKSIEKEIIIFQSRN